jgi:hypothetical protein
MKSKGGGIAASSIDEPINRGFSKIGEDAEVSALVLGFPGQPPSSLNHPTKNNYNSKSTYNFTKNYRISKF